MFLTYKTHSGLIINESLKGFNSNKNHNLLMLFQTHISIFENVGDFNLKRKKTFSKKTQNEQHFHFWIDHPFKAEVCNLCTCRQNED